jgi:hypothetical protein
MSPVARRLASAAALACAVAVAGCGLGPGPSSSGTAILTVTRDYGSKVLVEAAEEDPPSSETVMRLLDGNADLSTRYGGGFVQSIDGLAGGGGEDWFFYVNGVESPVGAAEVRVEGGDRIWWDYRDWTGAMSVPAVVGSWPEPFAQASADDRKPVRVVCLTAEGACAAAADRLADAGVRGSVEERSNDLAADGGSFRMLVGPWRAVRRDPAVDGLRGGPASTGVFAGFKGPIGRPRLIGLNAAGKPARDLGTGAGLVAALGRAGDPQAWIVTGAGGTAVRRAVGILDSRSLRDHYAVAAIRGRSVPLPLLDRSSGSP